MPPLEDLLQQCTVKITAPGGWGTGFFVAPGLILTCAHVVRKATDLRVTVSYPAWKQPLSAIVKARADDGKTLDLALVELSEPLPDHPCVLLDDEPVAIGQALYSYGYLESYANAAPVRPVNEGLTGDTPPLLKLQGAQIEKGISGAALLNLKTGKVCGMIKETRAAGFDLGGGAIPTCVILEQFPELRELQQAFHEQDRRWANLITTQSGIDVQPYLNSVVTTYEKWWQYYTLTDAEGKQRQKQESAPMFDFGLMVQTVTKQEREQEQQEKEKVERFSVLDGLRKYALGEKPEPVLLVGRPGSGKSTALARLMLEEASSQISTQTSEVSETSEVSASSKASTRPPKIPILVELRYWQGSLAQLIINGLKRHDLSVAADQLETVLNQALLLFDGVNELPSEEARTQLSAFRRDHPQVPMIFTTRDLSLGGDLGIERKLEMQPLTEEQMQAFIRVYVPEQAEAMMRQLKDRLREFGQTPLLLWMLCEVFKQSPIQQLPNNLGGIFQIFTRTYEDSSVRKHEVAALKGDVKPLTDRRLWKKALMAIAAIMMRGKTPIDFRVAIHRDEVERELSRVFPNEKFPVRDILDDLLKYHLLQNQTTDQIEFRHQLIQEYYAAEHLLAQLRQHPEWLEKEDGQDYPHFQKEYLNYLKWTEPIALMLGLVSNEAQITQVIELALDVDLMLGAKLAGKVQSNLQEMTISLVYNRANSPEWLAVELLGRIRSEHIIPKLEHHLQHNHFDIRSRAYGAFRGISSMLHPSYYESYYELFRQRALKEKGINRYLAISALNTDVKDLEDIRNFLNDSDLAAELKDTYDLLIQKAETIKDFLDPCQRGIRQSDDLGLCQMCIEFLILHRGHEVIPILIEGIKTQKSPSMKIKISEAIQELGYPEFLPQLWQVILENKGDVTWTIEQIQNRCKFYNYDIFSAHRTAQNADRPKSQNSDSSSITYNIVQVGNLNTGNISIHGDQIGGQTP